MTVSLPIEGDVIFPSHSTAKQRPVEELEAFFQKAWDHGVTAIAWTQYTPFFNDGDVCVFGAGGETYSNVELSDDDVRNVELYPDADDEIWSGIEYKPGYEWDRLSHGYKKIRGYKPPVGMLEAVDALNAINSGAFDDVLRSNFGEHAQVVATPEKFYVEYYDHE